ncbi:MAG: hypothetical protein CMN45_09335, partial [SAR116 cluster bacterium]|nr:hypothetical protein [SAR116 cluster bacterium]
YCRPQVASVGYTEQAALDAGYDIRVGRFPFRDVLPRLVTPCREI